MIRLSIIHKLCICVSVLPSHSLLNLSYLRPGSRPPRLLFKEDELIVSCLVVMRPRQIQTSYLNTIISGTKLFLLLIK